jgi:hypothetical protein
MRAIAVFIALVNAACAFSPGVMPMRMAAASRQVAVPRVSDPEMMPKVCEGTNACNSFRQRMHESYSPAAVCAPIHHVVESRLD